MAVVNSFWTDIDEVAIRDIASDPNFDATIAFIDVNRPFEPGLHAATNWFDGRYQVPPTQADIDAVVASVIAEVPNYLAEAGRRGMTPEEFDDLERMTRGIATREMTEPSVSFNSVSRYADIGMRVSVAHDACFVTLGGAVDTALFALSANVMDMKASKVLLVIDIILEVVGAVLGALGLILPKANVAKIISSIQSKLKLPGVNNAIQTFLSAVKNGDGSAILQAIQGIAGTGLLAAILGAWLDDMSFWDYVGAIATALALLVGAVSTGGATVAAKILTALGAIAALAVKLAGL